MKFKFQTVFFQKDYPSLLGILSSGVAIIPKSVKVERMIENREIFDVTLDAQDLTQIATLNRDEIIFNHRDPNMVKWLAEYRG